MKNFTFVNNIAGWLVFAIALVVYTLTLEPSVSLWDCGEFISASYHLQVVHPPGAPLFLMLGRLFSLFAMGDVKMVAFAVNMLSAFVSALTVLFTFWIIVHFARKIMGIALLQKEVDTASAITLLGAGAVGALALTFMDSFWFSAVEAEVYAASSCFTALSFWAILKWESVKDHPHSDRWLVFIAYTIGLSIGLHLLNLLVIPAVMYYYYFNRHPINRMNIIKASILGIGSLGIVQSVLIPGVPKLAALFDRIFVNGFGLPFHSGVFFTVVLIIGLIIFGIRFTQRRNMPVANLAVLCFAFIMIGYSSYTMVVVRSYADPAIDMNNPEDAYSLLSYIQREQYGDRPLLRGPHYVAKESRPIDVKYGAMQYRKGKKEYEEVGEKTDYIWDSKYLTWFPRMGDLTEKSQGYPIWIKISKGGIPTFRQNIGFFFKYQLGWMYTRYFLWNFAGRQSDQQNIDGNIFDGNWLSGIGPVDNIRLGPQDNLPQSLGYNKGRNKYYFLPLILGILGIMIQFKKQKLDGWVVTTLFVFTGIMIIVYLNQPPLEPRERDYSHAGSFQTFCIWIGLGVVFIADLLKRWMSNGMAGAAATLVGLLAAPALMGTQNWDDHDRSDRYLGISFAKNYLNSCDKNAILFTNGDNDTYPLWYAQNVEGVRQDVRVINMSLLSTDWYINALRKKVFESEALPLTIPEEKLVTGVREFTRYNDDKKRDQERYYPLKDAVTFMTSDDRNVQVTYDGAEFTNYLPVHKFIVPVDREAVLKNGVVKEKDSMRIEPDIKFDVGTGGLYKGNLVVLDIIATNAEQGWKRPIYFTTTTGAGAYMGLEEYFRHEGLTFRLVPFKSPKEQRGLIDPELLYDKLMNVYVWGNMEKGKMNLDEKAQLVPQNLRYLFVQVARDFIVANDKAKAIALMDKSLKVMPEKIMPMEPRLKVYYASTYFEAGSMDKGKKQINEITAIVKEDMGYYSRFTGNKRKDAAERMQESLTSLSEVVKIAKQYLGDAAAKKYEEEFNRLNTVQ
jgi:hypothetical protein